MKALLTADWHLRDSVPQCRKDDYWEAQEKKILFIKELQKKHSCPIYNAGDLFHVAKSSQMLERWAIDILPGNMYVIPGQHDLPNHSIDKIKESSLGVLQAARGADIRILDNPFQHPAVTKDITMIHTLVSDDGTEFHTDKVKYTKANSLLKNNPKEKLILTGDNHKSFTVKNKNQILVNPGSLMRMTIDQIADAPRIYLYDDKTGAVEAVFLPIEVDVMDGHYLISKKFRDERLESFVSRMNTDVEFDLSFEKNLEKFFNTNKTRKSVQEIIQEAING